MKLIILLFSVFAVVYCNKNIPSVFTKGAAGQNCFCKEKECTDVSCEEKNCLCLVVRVQFEKKNHEISLESITKKVTTKFICLFCDFYRKDSGHFPKKNAATKNHLPPTISNWFKNVVYVFKGVKRFATPMNSCKW